MIIIICVKKGRRKRTRQHWKLRSTSSRNIEIENPGKKLQRKILNLSLLMLYNHEVRRNAHFLYKIIHVSLFLERVQTWRVKGRDREKETDGWLRHRLADSKDFYIDLFLTHIVIPYSSPYEAASLSEGSRIVFAVGHCLPHLEPVYALRNSCLPKRNSKTDWSWAWPWDWALFCVYPCIYNFISPTHSFSRQPTAYILVLLVFR